MNTIRALQVTGSRTWTENKQTNKVVVLDTDTRSPRPSLMTQLPNNKPSDWSSVSARGGGVTFVNGFILTELCETMMFYQHFSICCFYIM